MLTILLVIQCECRRSL